MAATLLMLAASGVGRVTGCGDGRVGSGLAEGFNMVITVHGNTHFHSFGSKVSVTPT